MGESILMPSLQLSQWISIENEDLRMIQFACVFIKRSNFGFVIIAVYVDDLNLVGTLELWYSKRN